jgi:hypothetical protein
MRGDFKRTDASGLYGVLLGGGARRGSRRAGAGPAGVSPRRKDDHVRARQALSGLSPALETELLERQASKARGAGGAGRGRDVSASGRDGIARPRRTSRPSPRREPNWPPAARNKQRHVRPGLRPARFFQLGLVTESIAARPRREGCPPGREVPRGSRAQSVLRPPRGGNPECQDDQTDDGEAQNEGGERHCGEDDTEDTPAPVTSQRPQRIHDREEGSEPERHLAADDDSGRTVSGLSRLEVRPPQGFFALRSSLREAEVGRFRSG